MGACHNECKVSALQLRTSGCWGAPNWHSTLVQHAARRWACIPQSTYSTRMRQGIALWSLAWISLKVILCSVSQLSARSQSSKINSNTTLHIPLDLLDTAQLDLSYRLSWQGMKHMRATMLTTVHFYHTGLPINTKVGGLQPIYTQHYIMIQLRQNSAADSTMQSLGSPEHTTKGTQQVCDTST